MRELLLARRDYFSLIEYNVKALAAHSRKAGKK